MIVLNVGTNSVYFTLNEKFDFYSPSRRGSTVRLRYPPPRKVVRVLRIENCCI